MLIACSNQQQQPTSLSSSSSCHPHGKVNLIVMGTNSNVQQQLFLQEKQQQQQQQQQQQRLFYLSSSSLDDNNRRRHVMNRFYSFMVIFVHYATEMIRITLIGLIRLTHYVGTTIYHIMGPLYQQFYHRRRPHDTDRRRND
jgi:hypothetical protein